jgi:CTP:molybdopterin cytidylyltransferase MocA
MWPRGCYAALAALEGDVGGSELLKSGSASVPQVILVEAARAAELEDIDTPEDLIELERLA